MWALDTNVLIHHFQGKGLVSQRLLAHSPHELAVPAVVAYELQVGALKSNNPQVRLAQVERLLSVIQVLPLGMREAVEAAKIRVALEAAGQGIGPVDVLIAATARANALILVTHNLNEFKRVPALDCEDWFA